MKFTTLKLNTLPFINEKRENLFYFNHKTLPWKTSFKYFLDFSINFS
jgi:hypothetical protein